MDGAESHGRNVSGDRHMFRSFFAAQSVTAQAGRLGGSVPSLMTAPFGRVCRQLQGGLSHSSHSLQTQKSWRSQVAHLFSCTEKPKTITAQKRLHNAAMPKNTLFHPGDHEDLCRTLMACRSGDTWALKASFASQGKVFSSSSSASNSARSSNVSTCKGGGFGATKT